MAIIGCCEQQGLRVHVLNSVHIHIGLSILVFVVVVLVFIYCPRHDGFFWKPLLKFTKYNFVIFFPDPTRGLWLLQKTWPGPFTLVANVSFSFLLLELKYESECINSSNGGVQVRQNLCV